MNVGVFLGSFSFLVSDSWEEFIVVEIVGGSDVSFNCILWWVVELDGCRNDFFLEDYIVIYENEINIVVVWSTRFFCFEVGEDGVVYYLVDVGSGLILFWFFYYY